MELYFQVNKKCFTWVKQISFDISILTVEVPMWEVKLFMKLQLQGCHKYLERNDAAYLYRAAEKKLCIKL